MPEKSLARRASMGLVSSAGLALSRGVCVPAKGVMGVRPLRWSLGWGGALVWRRGSRSMLLAWGGVETQVDSRECL